MNPGIVMTKSGERKGHTCRVGTISVTPPRHGGFHNPRLGENQSSKERSFMPATRVCVSEPARQSWSDSDLISK